MMILPERHDGVEQLLRLLVPGFIDGVSEGRELYLLYAAVGIAKTAVARTLV